MSKRLHCSLDNSSGLFSFRKKKEKKKGKEEEAAYAAFIYFLTCPLHSSLPPTHGSETTDSVCWCWAVIFTITELGWEAAGGGRGGIADD